MKFLAMIELSRESKKAIDTACGLGSDTSVLPVYTKPLMEHDFLMGAGWAWKSWERENRLKARKVLQTFISRQREQNVNLEEPVVLSGSGEPVKSTAVYFLNNDYDIIICGAPFRDISVSGLVHRFQESIRKKGKDLPLWLVKRPEPIRRIVVLTDGSDTAEKAIGFLNNIICCMKDTHVTVISIKQPKEMNKDVLFLERGLAIFKEKEIQAQGLIEKVLTQKDLSLYLSMTDLLAIPLSSGQSVDVFDRFGTAPGSILFYLDGDTG